MALFFVFLIVGSYGNFTSCTPCPAGSATISIGMKSCSPCFPGFYCLSGSANFTQYPCPAGKYGSTYGLSSSSCSGACSAGMHFIICFI